LNEELIEALKDAARKCRLWALTMTTAAKSGHIGGSLSSMEMYLLIYGLANLTPQNARSTDRDHVVISHGHTSPGAYAALAYYGFIDAEEVMALFRKGGSPFPGHVEREVPGIDWSSGN
ncbi:MAG TPA: transketolase, partial [Thermovirga lienii]|nr:transketolase [Thermovirga lienii]